MNRPIKFRAWHPKKNRMWSWKDLIDSSIRMHSFERNSHLIFMEYTGLNDKNGKDIYEGDIFKWRDFTGMVRFYQGVFYLWNGFEVDPDKIQHEKLYQYTFNGEVIGNQFEDPELLEKLGDDNKVEFLSELE